MSRNALTSEPAQGVGLGALTSEPAQGVGRGALTSEPAQGVGRGALTSEPNRRLFINSSGKLASGVRQGITKLAIGELYEYSQ